MWLARSIYFASLRTAHGSRPSAKCQAATPILTGLGTSKKPFTRVKENGNKTMIKSCRCPSTRSYSLAQPWLKASLTPMSTQSAWPRSSYTEWTFRLTKLPSQWWSSDPVSLAHLQPNPCLAGQTLRAFCLVWPLPSEREWWNTCMVTQRPLWTSFLWTMSRASSSLP